MAALKVMFPRLRRNRVQAKGVVFRDLPEPGLYVEVGAIHRADNRSKGLAALLQVLADVADGGH